MSSFDEKVVLDVLEKVSKGVVNISTIRLVHHMFYQAIPVEGMGSGTIIDPNGYVLTNNRGWWGGEDRCDVVERRGFGRNVGRFMRCS